MIWRISIALFTMLSLAACATGGGVPAVRERIALADALPDSLGENGLLVGNIAADAVASTLIEKVWFSMAGVQIDDVYYSNAVRRNYLVLPLKPGDYTLEALHVYKTGDKGSGTRYPLQYKFRIVSGQATNLGIIALATRKSKENPEQKGLYWKVLVDNTDDMTAYLRKHHPKLAAGLRPATPILAQENKFADATMLEMTRRDLARSAWFRSEDLDRIHYVGAEAGTLAKILRNTQGKVSAMDVLDSGTKAAMVSCHGDDRRFVCSSAEPALYFIQNSKIEKRKLPLTASHVWVHTFPPQGLVLVDLNMNIYSSTDNGASWKQHVWYAPKKPLLPFARIKFENGRHGYYVYSTFSVDPLAPQVIYAEYSRPGYRKIDIPNMRNWQRLMENPAGLLVGPANSDKTDETANLYFQAMGQTGWQARPLPGSRCFFLERGKLNEEKLFVECDGKYYNSVDIGNTWTEYAVAKK
jgi:hypothetical protein